MVEYKIAASKGTQPETLNARRVQGLGNLIPLSCFMMHRLAIIHGSCHKNGVYRFSCAGPGPGPYPVGSGSGSGRPGPGPDPGPGQVGCPGPGPDPGPDRVRVLVPVRVPIHVRSRTN